MGMWLVKYGETVHYMPSLGELTEKVPEDMKDELRDVRNFIRNIKSERPEPDERPILRYVRRALRGGGDVLISLIGDKVFFKIPLKYIAPIARKN